MDSEPPPSVTPKIASVLITKFFPFKHVFEESIKPLSSYYDRNVYFEGVLESNDAASSGETKGEPFVLKMSSRDASPDIVEGLNAQMSFLSSRGFPCCFPLASRSCRLVAYASESEIMGCSGDTPRSSATGHGETKFLVRVFNYIAGEVMDQLHEKVLTSEVAFSVGEMAGRMDHMLQDFHHPALEKRVNAWDLQFFSNIRNYIPSIRDEKREVASAILTMFEDNVLPQLPLLKKGIIHNDVSGQNIVLKNNDGRYKIAGLLDFGECTYTCYLFELAAMLAYAKLEREKPVEFVAPMLRGYLEVFPLSKVELDCLYYSVLARLCQSAVLGEYRFMLERWNTYLLTTPTKAWRVISLMLKMSKKRVEDIWGIS